MPLFVRGGAIIPSQQDMQYTDQFPVNPLTLDVYPDGASSRQYYDDDGISFAYEKGGYLLQKLTADETASGVAVGISAPEGSFRPPKRSLVIRVHHQDFAPRSVTSSGTQLSPKMSEKDLSESGSGWMYDADSKTVWVKFPDQETAASVNVVR